MVGVFKRAYFEVSSIIENIDGGTGTSDTERSDTKATGALRMDADQITLTYTEKSESGNVHTSICKSGNTVTVKRSGAIDSLMVFEEGEHFSSLYTLGAYKFDMSLYTRKIRCDIGERGGVLRLIYDMEVGGAKKSCIMKITVSTEEVSL